MSRKRHIKLLWKHLDSYIVRIPILSVIIFFHSTCKKADIFLDKRIIIDFETIGSTRRGQSLYINTNL